jgi:hypothetical protein
LLAAGALLNADVPVAIQLFPSPRKGAYEVQQGDETTRMQARHLPITPKEGLFLPFRVSNYEPWAAERASIERLLCVVVEALLDWRTACICNHVPDLVFFQPLLKYLGKYLRLTDIFLVLPHSGKDVEEDADELLGMCFFHIAQRPLWQ